MTATLSCLPARVATAPDPLGLELRRPATDRWAAILPNPFDLARPYQVQYFTLAGLAGHHAYATPQAAYRAALAAGYTVPDAGALDRLSQTPAWRAVYDTSRRPPAPDRALRRPLQALTWLAQQGVTVEAITLRPGWIPPQIVVSGAAPALAWQLCARGHDRRGRYCRFTALVEGCQVVREVRDGPPRPHPRR